MPRVPPMGLSDPATQTVFLPRHSNEMNVVGHETIRPDFHAAPEAPLGHEFEIGFVVLVTPEGFLTAVPALSDVMGKMGNDHSGQASH